MDDFKRRRHSRVKGPEAEGLTLSLLSPLSLQETSSSDSRKEEHGEEEASTSSNFLFSIPLMARRICTWNERQQRGHTLFNIQFRAFIILNTLN